MQVSTFYSTVCCIFARPVTTRYLHTATSVAAACVTGTCLRYLYILYSAQSAYSWHLHAKLSAGLGDGGALRSGDSQSLDRGVYVTGAFPDYSCRRRSHYFSSLDTKNSMKLRKIYYLLSVFSYTHDFKVNVPLLKVELANIL